ncbi:MAG: HAMP domain-containing sensor histidine kinase [Gammaproteobacteria bacterium]
MSQPADTLQSGIQQQARLSAMGEMMAKLAHQLRTPLSSTLLYASNLTRPGLSEHRRKEFTRQVVDGLQHLDTILNDMLVFSKGGQSGDDCIAVSDLLHEVKHTVNHQLQQAEVNWSVEINEDCYIQGNHSMLAGVLVNLVTNALNARQENLKLVWKVQIQDQLVQLILQDNGPGIDGHLRGKIFEPFFTTRANGTGLGLAVAKSVIQAHQGTIELATDYRQVSETGACFVIRLPASLKNKLLASQAGFTDEDEFLSAVKVCV